MQSSGYWGYQTKGCGLFFPVGYYPLNHLNIGESESTEGHGLPRGELPGCANYLNGIVTAYCFHLVHYSAYMILHCVLRQIQVCRDFLIRQSACYKPDELELPRSEGLRFAILQMRWLEFLRSLFAQMLNQGHAKARGTSGFATDSGTHRRDDLRS